jgi:hypothetical protein
MRRDSRRGKERWVGPRLAVGVPGCANAHWRKELLEDCFKHMHEHWPKDGVAIAIRAKEDT